MEQRAEQRTTWIETVFDALRAYRRPTPNNVPAAFHALAWMAQELRAPHAPTGAVAPGWAMRRLLEQAVAALGEQEPEMADLLATRFLQGKSVIAAAQALGLSESSIYYRQKQAIQLLAHLIAVREQSFQATPTEVMSVVPPVGVQAPPITSLPPPTYSRLFGLDKKIATLQNALVANTAPWTIMILGLGGMGKSTLAHTVSTWAAQQTPFTRTIWLTAKQEEYNTWQGQRQATATPATVEQPPLAATLPDAQAPLTYEKLLDAVAAQLGLQELPRPADWANEQEGANRQRKQEQICAVLREQPALIVIDNLESIVHDTALVQGVQALVRPSKILLTSRHAVDLPELFLVRMDELTWEDSLALLCHEAEQRGFGELRHAPPATLAPLYELVGGNPLALKLVVGQLTSLPLHEVIQRLKQARKSSERAEYELYHYLYWQSWRLLSEPAREVMLTMPVLPQRGVTWELLLQASGLSRPQLSDAVNELLNYSLLNAGGWPDKHYSIHQLTHTFLMTEVLKWW
jgi:hypothetical protein